MIWIIGTGTIAQEYAKVLKVLESDFIVIGRSGKNSSSLIKYGAKKVITGGLENFLQTIPVKPSKVIVAVNVVELSKIVRLLLYFGVKDIFCEKPGFCSPAELPALLKSADEHFANVYLAYNRRFFASTLIAEKIINEDGGVKSFNFEFTEWGHVIVSSGNDEKVLNNWMYSNSTHVIDLAFFLGGEPKVISTFVSGELPWHKPAIFAGAGVTENNALFTYQANWFAPGRWGIEVLTSKHRLYLRPMEKLQIQNIGSVEITNVEVDYTLDENFKPGFYLQTKAFIENDVTRLCSLKEQGNHMVHYKKIKGDE